MKNLSEQKCHGSNYNIRKEWSRSFDGPKIDSINLNKAESPISLMFASKLHPGLKSGGFLLFKDTVVMYVYFYYLIENVSYHLYREIVNLDKI